jgi:hypothetical protein
LTCNWQKKLYVLIGNMLFVHRNASFIYNFIQ